MREDQGWSPPPPPPPPPPSPGGGGGGAMSENTNLTSDYPDNCTAGPKLTVNISS